MACKIPVICFKNTASAEIIEHKKHGYVVEDFSSDELKKAIEWMSNENEIKKIDSDKIRQKAQNFDSNKIALEYIELYSRILKK